MAIKETTAELVLDERAEIAESPLWDHRYGRLVWADIYRNVIWRSNVGDGCSEKQRLDQPIGCLAVHRDEGYVMAGGDGFYAIGKLGDEPVLIASAFDDSRQKLNDGKVDPQGRFWSGSGCRNGVRAKGALYCLDRDRSSRTIFGGVTASNGFDWSPDGCLFYYVDTAAGGVDVFDVGRDSDELLRRRRFVDVPPETGLADGLTVDIEGCVWLAVWYAGAVFRYAPTGRLIAKVTVPVCRTSSCVFGGDYLQTLFITTARGGEDRGRPIETPAGGIYAIETDTAGQLRPGYLG